MLRGWRTAVESYLATLRLTIHPDKSVVFPVATGIPFLGFQVFPDRRRLLKGNVRAFLRRSSRQRRDIRRGDLTFDLIKPSLVAWNAHADHGDTWRLRMKLFYQRPIPAIKT